MKQSHIIMLNKNFKAEKWINDLSGILSDEWSANLKSLAVKHPEMFRSEADVFRVIKEIKDNPTHFFKNDNERNALIAKELKSGKAGNIAIEKESGEIVHTNKTEKRDLKRLSNKQADNYKKSGIVAGTPTPANLSLKSKEDGDLLRTKTANKRTLPQTKKKNNNNYYWRKRRKKKSSGQANAGTNASAAAAGSGGQK